MAALKNLKGGKGVGVDGTPAEFWKNLGEEGTSELDDIYMSMYEGVIKAFI